LCLRGVTHTLELGILVRAVLLTVVTLTWSLITDYVRSSLHATLFVPSSVLTAGHRIMRHTARIPYPPYPLLGGSPVELLHFSHFHHASLVQWTNRLLPTAGGSSPCPGYNSDFGTGITCKRCLATTQYL
jgi:hypothetical protein